MGLNKKYNATRSFSGAHAGDAAVGEVDPSSFLASAMVSAEACLFIFRLSLGSDQPGNSRNNGSYSGWKTKSMKPRFDLARPTWSVKPSINAVTGMPSWRSAETCSVNSSARRAAHLADIG